MRERCPLFRTGFVVSGDSTGAFFLPLSGVCTYSPWRCFNSHFMFSTNAGV